MSMPLCHCMASSLFCSSKIVSRAGFGTASTWAYCCVEHLLYLHLEHFINYTLYSIIYNHSANNISIFRSNCICAQYICDNKYDIPISSRVAFNSTSVVNSTNHLLCSCQLKLL